MLDDDFVFFRGVGELTAFDDVVGDGFFDVGVLAVGGSGCGDEGVGVVRGGDDDCIDVFGFACLPVVFEFLDFDVFLGEFVGKGIEDIGIHIAEGNKLRAFGVDNFVGEGFATAVEADYADAEVAVGTACRTGEGWAESEGSGKGGGGEEITSCRFHGFLKLLGLCWEGFIDVIEFGGFEGSVVDDDGVGEGDGFALFEGMVADGLVGVRFEIVNSEGVDGEEAVIAGMPV